MPTAFWDTYRLGAQLPSLDASVAADVRAKVGRLQAALSSVAYISKGAMPYEGPTVEADDSFIGRLMLGLLCRGWPTFASPWVEEAILASIDPVAGIRHRSVGRDGAVGWRLDVSDSQTINWSYAVQRALLRGDARLGIDDEKINSLCDSPSEADFYRERLAPLLGQAIGWLELQRPLASMVREDAPNPDRYGSERVDFALDLPGEHGPIRRVIELDGPHHRTQPQRDIDDRRDSLLGQHGWRISRVPVETLNEDRLNGLSGTVQAIIKQNRFPFTYIEEGSSALDDPRTREATRLALTPHAIARVQLALSRALMDGDLRLADASWTVAVVERDVPCAEIAVRDWLQSVFHLCQLYGIRPRLEQVRLLVAAEYPALFPRLNWPGERAGLPRVDLTRLLVGAEVELIDLGIDVSVAAHPTRRYPTDPLAGTGLLIARHAVLRTAQRQSGYRVDRWPQPREMDDPRAMESSLTHFLQLLFRKEGFRAGQMEIIERVLRRQDVIGLLPTGAGKSITFQLPALLSPGLSLVIDPIKSLMQDQVDNLRDKAGVMDTTQINSDMSTKERDRVEWQFAQGEYRMIFISPERLQIADFRDRLRTTTTARPVAFVVVDEAHCVSEWGHDFRTAYLNLGRVAARFCGGGERPPLVALTGTASEMVLRDIRRELDVSDEAIVRPADFGRKELKFEIVPVAKGAKSSRLVQLITKVIPERLGVAPDRLADGWCGGLVFCPHVNGRLGVFSVAESVRNGPPMFRDAQASGAMDGQPRPRLVEYYSGEPPDRSGMTDAVFAQHKAAVQRAFKDDRTRLLVATSAFGMGIDKPNIRYTIHFAMAKSVEAFAQEAGRAGRDRNEAICAVLWTDRLRKRNDAEEPPPDCLDLAVPVEVAKDRADAAGWDSDDAEVQMYLHSLGYQGVTRESAAVRALYHHWIEPHLVDVGEQADQSVELPIHEEAYRKRIGPLIGESSPGASTTEADETTDRDETKLPKPELQRLIYRLALLGIVEDYTVIYRRAGQSVYVLRVRRLSESECEGNLFKYMRRYEWDSELKGARGRLAASTLEDPICRLIDTLCWFVYAEIEQRRRQSMWFMRQMLRESKDGADLGRRLNEALSNTAMTQKVFDLLAVDDDRAWSQVSREIAVAETAEHVYYQCLRALEDAPGHPGLTLLSGLALLGTDASRQSEVIGHLSFGWRQSRQALPTDAQTRIAGWLVAELARIGSDTAPRVLVGMLRENPDQSLARAALRGVRNGSLERDPALVRMGERCLLQQIDGRIAHYLHA